MDDDEVLVRLRKTYAEQPFESPEERRRRLASHRAAKYRYLKSLEEAQEVRREQNNRRQRDRRQELDESTKSRIRELNRVRQQQRRQTLDDQSRDKIREQQRQRQQVRRTNLDDESRDALRERERLRVRLRRARNATTTSNATAACATHPSVATAATTLSTSPPRSPLPPLLLSFVSLTPPPALPSADRLARTAINANGVLNSDDNDDDLSPIRDDSPLQFPPVRCVTSSSSMSNSVANRFDLELPSLPPHLPSIQPPPPPPPPPSIHPTFSSYQFAALPSASATPSATSTSAFSDRMPQLPQLQLALPQASSLLNTPSQPPPLLYQLPSLPVSVQTPTLPTIAVAAAAAHNSTVASLLPTPSSLSSSSSVGGSRLLSPPPSSHSQLLLQQQQQQQHPMLPSIAIPPPPPVRAPLPPLPDFLNNTREPFSGAFFPHFTDHVSEYHDSVDTLFRSW